MIDRCIAIMDLIALTTIPDTKFSASLLGGNIGRILFLKQYASFSKKEFDVEMSQTIEKISLQPVTTYTFCNGAAGVQWLYNLLLAERLLDPDDWEVVSINRKVIEQQSLFELGRNNYDFLHGGVGMAWTLLKYPFHSNETGKYFEQFFEKLMVIMTANKDLMMFEDFDFLKYKKNTGVVNLGLAHGIPAILKLCLQCVRMGVCTSQAKSMGLRIVAFIMAHVNADSSQCYFPGMVSKTEKTNSDSRLAWCYGDPGVCITLFEAGHAFNKPELIEFSIESLLKSTKRISKADTGVKDASFCHGTSGIAHIYNKMWNNTKIDAFRVATDYWISKTLKFADLAKKSSIQYKVFDPRSNTYEISYGILEGATGVGLVLHSYVTNDFSWDDCLMLSK